MLIKPVLSYLPAQNPTSSLASSLKLTVMLQQGDSGWLLQMRLSSSWNFPLLRNRQPVIAGRWGSATGAFSRASFSSSPTSQSAPDLVRFRERVGAFLTCTARTPSPLESLWSEPVCRLESPPFLLQAEDQTYQRLDPRGCCSHPSLKAPCLQYFRLSEQCCSHLSLLMFYLPGCIFKDTTCAPSFSSIFRTLKTRS